VRYPPDQRLKTRERILSAAADLLRRRGIAATGVDHVMAAAGLTAGGFYTHFRSKDALITDAIETAADKARERWYSPFDHLRGEAWAERLIQTYLSPEHRDDLDGGCILPSLACDVTRSTPTSRKHFARRLQGLFVHATARSQGEIAPERPAIIAAIALCVGGIVLSRVVPERRFAHEILEAARLGAAQLLGLKGTPRRGDECTLSERSEKPT
jgi:TetR/AcrR family transcriptional regulator, transcriptional repressor for nem operon